MLKTKINKVVFIDTITREFIKFAKIMGIFPSICFHFRNFTRFELPNETAIQYFRKNSFYEYARREGRYYLTLNDNLIKYVYLFSNRWSYPIDKFENTNELADLFISHLKDKGYSRYIRIIH